MTAESVLLFFAIIILIGWFAYGVRYLWCVPIGGQPAPWPCHLITRSSK